MSIHEAARDGKVHVVRTLLEQNPKEALAVDDDTRTALHWACTMQHPAIVQLLLPHIGDVDDVVDNAGWTPMHIAAAVGNGEIVELLMAHNPAPDVDLATGTGATALHLAVSKTHADIVHQLVHKHKCSVRAKDKLGRTALHRAAAAGNQPMVRELVAARAVVNAADKDGWTPLHHALAEGHGDVGVLLVELGADAGIAASSGETAVEVAPEGVRKYFEAATQ